jgi:hypothetical protein
MTDITDYVNNGAEFLRHYGAKGMKWGVRKDRGHEGNLATNRKIARLDKKFVRKALDDKFIRNVKARAVNNYKKHDMKVINRRYSARKLRKSEATRKKYHQDHADAVLKHIRNELRKEGTSASGTYEYTTRDSGAGDGHVAIDVRWVKGHDGRQARVGYTHASMDDSGDETTTMTFTWVYDEEGLIKDILTNDEMAQYTMAGEDFLEHFGKKGMKWGVRKDYKSWKKESTSAAAGQKVVDAAIKSFQPDLKKINNDPMFKGKDLTKDKKLNRQYQELAAARFNDHLVTHSINQSATTMHGGRAVVWQMGLGPGGPRFRPVIM